MKQKQSQIPRIPTRPSASSPSPNGLPGKRQPVTEEQQKQESNDPIRDEHVPSLEDTSDGSTEPFASAGKSKKSGSIVPTSAGETILSESSSGGFETMLGTVLVENGLVTPEELELCNSLLLETAKGEAAEPRTLADLLVKNGFVTAHQLSRVRSDFEAKKSSQRIPGYRIKQKLGSGAMATVFLAHQLSLDRPVAIKVLPKKFSDNVGFIERFYKEGRAAAKLNHPNIVGAYDVGQAGEHHYFVMEYVDGVTVYDRLIKDKRMSEADAIRIIIQVAKALEHAHAKGFIHRDIKPKNIMISSQGVVKLADLGLARALSDKDAAKSEAGRAYGTPYYISPEQIRGEVKIGPPADIYGLGATFYHMVTGRVPFEGKNPSVVMHQHLKDELTPPDHINPKLSGGCAQVIEMMMAKSESERYHNVTDLLHDLDLVADGKPPHFARRQLDLVEVATSIASDNAGTAPVVQRKLASPSPLNNQLFATMMVVLFLSLVANLILLIFVLAN